MSGPEDAGGVLPPGGRRGAGRPTGAPDSPFHPARAESYSFRTQIPGPERRSRSRFPRGHARGRRSPSSSPAGRWGPLRVATYDLRRPPANSRPTAPCLCPAGRDRRPARGGPRQGLCRGRWRALGASEAPGHPPKTAPAGGPPATGGGEWIYRPKSPLAGTRIHGRGSRCPKAPIPADTTSTFGPPRVAAAPGATELRPGRGPGRPAGRREPVAWTWPG